MSVNEPELVKSILEASEMLTSQALEIVELRGQVKRLRDEVQSLTDELAYHGIYPRDTLESKP